MDLAALISGTFTYPLVLKEFQTSQLRPTSLACLRKNQPHGNDQKMAWAAWCGAALTHPLPRAG